MSAGCYYEKHVQHLATKCSKMDDQPNDSSMNQPYGREVLVHLLRRNNGNDSGNCHKTRKEEEEEENTHGKGKGRKRERNKERKKEKEGKEK